MFVMIAILVVYILGVAADSQRVMRAQPQGIDVASHQGNVNWAKVASSGIEFAYIKATQNNSTR